MTYLPSTQSLRTFETAARVLNFTHTAAELYLTQGAVSHQIRELEKIVGVPLFERQARGLSLTDAGAEYLPFVREALERLRRIGGSFPIPPRQCPNGYDIAELRQ